MFAESGMTIEPLSADGHIPFAPNSDIDPALAKIGLDVLFAFT